jgi:hypothetical protein
LPRSQGPAVDLAERERLVRDLGPYDAMSLRNHGLLTCGATLQQGFNTMYQLEMSCRAQIDMLVPHGIHIAHLGSGGMDSKAVSAWRAPPFWRTGMACHASDCPRQPARTRASQITRYSEQAPPCR